jgi:hypothetical protein
MTSLQILDLALKILTLLGVIFAVYLYFKKPQEDSKITDVEFEKDLSHLKEDTNKKFIEMIAGFNKSIELALNHSHTVETKIDAHIKESQAKGEADARWQGRIETLLEERLK